MALQTDSSSAARLNYRSALVTVHSELPSRDVKSIKFLCSDFISIGKMESIRDSLGLITELEKQRKIQSDNVIFLAECLLHIGRRDLLRCLGYRLDTLNDAIQRHGSQISLYRRLLFHVCQELTTENLSSLKFVCDLPRPKMEAIQDPEDLIQTLEKQLRISPDSLEYLTGLLEAVKRDDLVAKIRQYQTNTGGVTNAGVSLVNNGVIERSGENIAVSHRHAVVSDARQQSTGWREPLQNIASPNIRLREDEMNANQIQDQVQQARGQSEVVGQNLSGGIVNVSNAPSTRDDNLSPDGPGDVAANQHVEYYAMTRKPRGICLIINNKTFFKVADDPNSKLMKPREGTDIDCDLLKTTFTRFHFRVVVVSDATASDLSRVLNQYAMRENHAAYDCFVCCILSHGLEGQVYGADGRLVDIRDLLNDFKAGRCPTLRDKPKVFFIQACQGKTMQRGYGVVDTDAPDTESGGILGFEIPNEADFLVGYATIPGYVSYRSRSQGTWYITTLVRIINEHAQKLDLLTILLKVNNELSKLNAPTKEGHFNKQSPAPIFSLRKHVFLGDTPPT